MDLTLLPIDEDEDDLIERARDPTSEDRGRLLRRMDPLPVLKGTRHIKKKDSTIKYKKQSQELRDNYTN